MSVQTEPAILAGSVDRYRGSILIDPLSRFAVGLVATVLGCADRPAEQAPMTNQMPITKQMPHPPPCAGTATRSGNVYALQFELRNDGAAPAALSTYQPFLAFTFSASAGGTRVTVQQPALDLPVQPITLTIPAHGTLTVRTPIKLRLAPGAAIDSDPFIWTIDHVIDGLTASATLQLPPPYDAPCSIAFAQ